MSKCLLCKNLDLRADTRMSLLGFGKCALDEVKAHSVSFKYERHCDDYEQVASAVKVKREIWAEQLTAKKV